MASKCNQVLRDYITKRTWSTNNEVRLIRWFILQDSKDGPSEWAGNRDGIDKFHREYPLLIEYEWEVQESRTDRGRGDLVFTDGHGRFAVVEVKMIQGETLTGPTARANRNQNRKKLEEQASFYCEEYAKRCQDSGCLPCISVNGYGLSEEGFNLCARIVMGRH
jgi:Holliday junction resolvase-like predicted endonuclease